MSKTVKELIEELQKCNPDALVVTSHWEDSGCSCGYEVKEELNYVSPSTWRNPRTSESGIAVVELSFSRKW
jgi:hypothetical protein